MTMLEVLDFVAQLHDHIERNVDRPGPWCWPIRELVNQNLTANKAQFRDKYPVNSFGTTLRDARAKGWIVVGPCDSHCHADHLRLTQTGIEMLKLMRTHGCESGDHVSEKTAKVYKFQRKVA